MRFPFVFMQEAYFYVTGYITGQKSRIRRAEKLHIFHGICTLLTKRSTMLCFFFFFQEKSKSGKSLRIKCECHIFAGTRLLVSTRCGYGAYSEFNFANDGSVSGRRKGEYCMLWGATVTNAVTKQRTNTRDIVRVSHIRQWIWGGHVARMGQIRLRASMWDVRIGKRRTG